MDAPLVSAIIIFLNAGKFLAEAVESVFAQTYQDWELLLVDDGSSDGSSALALKYASEHPGRVRCLEHANHANRGMSASRNLGIANARGEYVAFLDADDVWLPHKLAEQVDLLQRHPRAMMIYGRTEIWHSWTGLPEDSGRDFTYDLGVPADSLIEPPRLLILLLQNEAQTPTTCNVMIRRELFEQTGGFVEAFGGLFEDQAFFAKACLKAPVYVAGTRWARYRQHPESCCARAASDGTDFRDRYRLLRWIEQFLTREAVIDKGIWRTLRDQYAQYPDDPGAPPMDPSYRKVRVSVVVPFRNPGPHFRNMLESLAGQECDEGWEVVAIDNGSSDGSRAVAETFSGRLPLRILPAGEKPGAGHARNVGASVAVGEKLIFIDADDEVAPGYLAAMAGALNWHDIVTSLVDSTTLNPEWVRAAHGQPWQEKSIMTFFDFLPAAGNNIGVRRGLFEAVGSFPEEYSASEDIAFSWRIQLIAEKQLHLVPEALYRYRYRETLAGLYLQAVRWGASTVLLYYQFRAAGMPARHWRASLAEWSHSILGLLRARSRAGIAPHVMRIGFCVGRLAGSLRYRIAYL
jgi:glycosyltransferase involved in cell wall biosynthesis